MKKHTTEIVVVGAGAAGLVSSLELAPKKVMVLAKAPVGEGSSSAWAQGGMAAAVGPQDDPEQHKEDTLRVSAGLGEDTMVQTLCEEGPRLINQLIAWGVQFDRNEDGHLSLSREAAHRHRRVLHAGGDSTGAELMRGLGQAVQKAAHIDIQPDLTVFRLVKQKGRVAGVLAMDQNGLPVLIEAGAVVLATGGLGQMFGVTTNPKESFGDGLAMAAEAGAVLKDLEFIQFHPTAMDIGKTPMPLATEALRGEGAYLIDETGARFMKKIHPDAELAPRDVVARAIWGRVKQDQKVYLDCRTTIGASFQEKFPTVWASCQEVGLDPVEMAIPIKPAAHYHMGGIATDEWGRTNLKGLWAVGEVACNGVHGANRLASNSLLEAVVFGQKAARNIKGQPLEVPATGPVQLPALTGRDESQKLAEIMYKACGVERSEESLKTGLDSLRKWQSLEEPMSILFENRLKLARMILAMALQRKESRGGHYRVDYPQTRSAYQKHNEKTLKQIDLFLNGQAPFEKWGTEDTSWPKTKALS